MSFSYSVYLNHSEFKVTFLIQIDKFVVYASNGTCTCYLDSQTNILLMSAEQSRHMWISFAEGLDDHFH